MRIFPGRDTEAEGGIAEARVVSLECDKCGLEIRNDMSRIILWRHRIKFEKYDVRKLIGDNEEVYLCGNCAKEFRKWLKEG